MKALVGTVVSNKMTKTVVVERTITRAHPFYSKVVRYHRRLKAHSVMPLSVGDVVKIVATRPVAKEIHYRVVEKISKETSNPKAVKKETKP